MKTRLAARSIPVMVLLSLGCGDPDGLPCAGLPEPECIELGPTCLPVYGTPVYATERVFAGCRTICEAGGAACGGPDSTVCAADPDWECWDFQSYALPDGWHTLSETEGCSDLKACAED